MSDSKAVWLITSLNASATLPEVTEEAFNPALLVAEKMGSSVSVILLSGQQNSQSACEALGHLGASKVRVLASSGAANETPTETAKAIAELIRAEQPGTVFLAGSDLQDIAPRIAALSESALISQASAIEVSGNDVLSTRSYYGEALLRQLKSNTPTKLITLKAKAFPKATIDASKQASVENLAAISDSSDTLKRLSVRPLESKGAKLEEADIVVSGGRGLKEASNFNIVEDLATLLGAAVGASRAVVDAGWRPHSEQVGQTGKTVSPKLYIALGISGALQHLVGMNTSQRIIAINRDENAPIFKSCDFGVIGDVTAIVPALTQAIRTKQG